MAAKRIIDSQLKKDLSNGDDWLYSSTMKQFGMYSKDEMLELGKSIKFRDEDQRARYMQLVEDMYNMKDIGEK